MAKKDVVREKWYVASKPGFCISLPEGLIYKETTGGVTRSKKNISFRDVAGKMIKTSQPEIQEFIESSFAFGRTITKVPTPAEIAEHQKEVERAKQLKFYQEMLSRPEVTINFRSMSDSDIREVADKIGAETSDGEKKLSKSDIVDNVETLIFGAVKSKKS